MAPSLRPLGNDRSGAGFDRFINVSQRLHLADQLGTAASNRFGERPRVAEREKHTRGRMAKRFIEHVGHARQRPRYEPDAELVASDMREFLPEVRLAAKNAAIAATDNPKAPRVRYGGR